MPNYITTLVKQRYPEFADIPDDELTLRYAKDYPDQLDDPEFKADYIRIKSASKTPKPRMQTVGEGLIDPAGWGRSAGNLAGAAAKGVVGLGEGLVGLADIASFGWAGYGLEKGLGYDPRYLKQLITDNLQSELMREQQANVEKAKGFTGTAKALIENPLALTDTLLESGVSMAGGQAITKGLIKAAPAINKLAALGAGEGTITAGNTAESIRQQNSDGLLTADQAFMSLLTGLATGTITAASGGLSKRAGLGDVDSLLLDGQRVTVPRHIGVRVPAGAAVEGVEEFLQSTQEAIAQNIALGRPWDQGVDKQGAIGMVSGKVMGAGMSVPGGINPSAAIDRVNAQLAANEEARTVPDWYKEYQDQADAYAEWIAGGGLPAETGAPVSSPPDAANLPSPPAATGEKGQKGQGAGSDATALNLSDALDKVESLRLEWPEQSRMAKALWDITQNPAASAETKARALAAYEDLLSKAQIQELGDLEAVEAARKAADRKAFEGDAISAEITAKRQAQLKAELEAEAASESGADEDPFLELLDKAEKRLNKLGLKHGKDMFEGVISSPVWLTRDAANALISVIRISYRVSKSVSGSVSAALDWLRKQNIQGFNDREAVAHIEALVKKHSEYQESPSKSLAASSKLVPAGELTSGTPAPLEMGTTSAASLPLVTRVAPGENIASAGRGGSELGQALTNVTHGKFPITKPDLVAGLVKAGLKKPINGQSAEHWYQANKADFSDPNQDAKDMAVMELIIAAKLNQYRGLVTAIDSKGGSAWLLSSKHSVFGNAYRRRPSGFSWEGSGANSAFIRVLNDAYTKVTNMPSDLRNKDGSIRYGSTNGRVITIRPVTDASAFFDYLEGRVDGPTSAQKAKVTEVLAKLGYPIDVIKAILNSNSLINRFLVLHEQSHIENGDKDVYWLNGKDLLTPDKIAIEVRATVYALEKLGGLPLAATTTAAQPAGVAPGENIASPAEILELASKNETTVISEHSSPSYGPRTKYNADSAGLTVAIALDYDSPGEVLTKKVAGAKYLAIPLNVKPETGGYKLAVAMRKLGTDTLNVAGNAIQTLKSHGRTQESVNQHVYDLIATAHKLHPIAKIVTGGQTGVDIAGAIAARALGIPAVVTMPKGFLQRYASGLDVRHTSSEIEAKIADGAFGLSSSSKPTLNLQDLTALNLNSKSFALRESLDARTLKLVNDAMAAYTETAKSIPDTVPFSNTDLLERISQGAEVQSALKDVRQELEKYFLLKLNGSWEYPQSDRLRSEKYIVSRMTHLKDQVTHIASEMRALFERGTKAKPKAPSAFVLQYYFNDFLTRYFKRNQNWPRYRQALLDRGVDLPLNYKAPNNRFSPRPPDAPESDHVVLADANASEAADSLARFGPIGDKALRDRFLSRFTATYNKLAREQGGAKVTKKRVQAKLILSAWSAAVNESREMMDSKNHSATAAEREFVGNLPEKPWSGISLVVPLDPKSKSDPVHAESVDDISSIEGYGLDSLSSIMKERDRVIAAFRQLNDRLKVLQYGGRFVSATDSNAIREAERLLVRRRNIIRSAFVRVAVERAKNRIDPEGLIDYNPSPDAAESESEIRDNFENEERGRNNSDGKNDDRDPFYGEAEEGEEIDFDRTLQDNRRGMVDYRKIDSSNLQRVIDDVYVLASDLYSMNDDGSWAKSEPERVSLEGNIDNLTRRFNPRRLREPKTEDDYERIREREEEFLQQERDGLVVDSVRLAEAIRAIYAEYTKQNIGDSDSLMAEENASFAAIGLPDKIDRNGWSAKRVLRDGFELFLQWLKNSVNTLHFNGQSDVADRMLEFFTSTGAYADNPLQSSLNEERAKTAHLLQFLERHNDGSAAFRKMIERAQRLLSQDFERSETQMANNQIVARYSLAAPTADGITPVPDSPSLALFLQAQVVSSGIPVLAGSVVIVHLPASPHVEGWFAPDGTIHLNSSAPSMRDAANVQRVIREEFKHRTLNTPDGRNHIRRIFHKLTRADIGLLESQGYRQGPKESNDDYLNRLTDEFIAKHSRLKTSLWNNLTLRIKSLFDSLGVRSMTLIEAADSVHMALNLDKFGGSSGKLTLNSTVGSSGRLSRMLTPTSGLGAKLKNIVDLGYSRIDGIKRQALSAQNKLNKAILEDFGVPYEDLPENVKAEIFGYLKESSNPLAAPILKSGGYATATMAELKIARNTINKLSAKYHHLAAPFLDPSLLDTIKNNDSYLTRSYQMFSDPNWIDDLKQKIKAGTDPKLTAAFRAAVLDSKSSSNYAKAVLEVYRNLNSLLDSASIAGAPSSIADMNGSTVRRENVPDFMKVLMGEVTDPAVVLGVTLGSLESKIVYYQTMNSFVGQALKDGLISEGGEGNPTHDRSMNSAPGKDPFSQYYTTENFLLHVQELRQHQKESSALLDFVATVSRLSKVYQVAGSLGFIAQQLFGNTISLIQMGHFTSALSLPSGTVKVLRDRFGKSAEADFAEFTKLASYGLLNDNQMTPLVKARIADCVMGIPLYEQLNAVNKFRGGVDNFLQMLSSVDTAAKIIAFYSEAAAITEAYADAPAAERLSADQIDKAASDRVRERMPSISRTPLALRHLDYLPFVGQYTIFAYLSCYNLVKNIQYSLLDLKNPRMRKIGLKSLSGIAASAAISAGVLKLALQAILGAASPDEEKEFMDGRKSWDKEKRWVVYKGSDRIIRGFSLDSLDPMTNMSKAFSALYKGVATEASLADSVVGAVGYVLSPLLQEGKITKVWGEILEGEDSLDRRIWDDSDGRLDKVLKSLLYVGKNIFTPSSFRKFIDEIGPAAFEEGRRGGRPSTLTMLVVGELTATHPEYLSREGAIRRQMRELLATNRRLGTDSSRGLLTRRKETQADVDKRYNKFLKDRASAFESASTSIRRLAKGGRFTDDRLFELGKQSDLSYASIRSLLTGEQREYRLSLEAQNDIIQLNAQRDFTNPLPANLLKQFRAIDKSGPDNIYSPRRTTSERKSSLYHSDAESNIYHKMNN